jgi:protein O-GlcNAc transferase
LLPQATGDLEAAKRCFLEAIRIRPDFAIAWSNLAGPLSVSLSLSVSLTLVPLSVSLSLFSHRPTSGVFKGEGQFRTAIAYYQEAIRLCPEFADAHSNLGNVLKESGQLDEAIASYQVSFSLSLRCPLISSA